MHNDTKPEANAPVLEKVRWITREVQDDCERDTFAREHRPMTGPNMAAWLGEISGTLAGLATAVEMLTEQVSLLVIDLDNLERTR